MNPELRFQVYGKNGYFRLRIPSEADAIKILVLTRGCGQGFCFIKGGDGIIKTSGPGWIKQSSNCWKLLQKYGYVDPKQIL